MINALITGTLIKDPATRTTKAGNTMATATKAVNIEGKNYQSWLKRRTGETSCAELDDTQLTAVTDSLKPTTKQWRRVLELCAELGLSGFEDERFKAFVHRITKVDDSRLLSRLQLRKLIYAMGQWAKSQHQKAAATTTPTAD